MVARGVRSFFWGSRRSPPAQGRPQQHCIDACRGQQAGCVGQRDIETVFPLSVADTRTSASPVAVQVSVLIDTDLLSLLERKRIPVRLQAWLDQQADILISVVSLAELEFGVRRAPSAHRAALADWLAQTRRKFGSSTEELTESVLVRWKELLADLKRQKRTITCEDSLIAATALYHGHSLATRNRRHFEPAGVEIIDPLE